MTEVHEPATKEPRATDLGGEALEMLVNFIAKAFEQRHELKLFVAQLHGGDELLISLPGELASPASTAYALIAAVTSRGLLDQEFFAVLLRARPRLSARINAIRQRCLTVDDPAGTISPGVVLRSGRYKLQEIIDHGAVAAVWRAYDRHNDTQVAIKVLRRDMRDYRLRRWQFIKGANHLASISHPRVARVIEPHFNEMGLDFCVLQFVEGRSLAEEVKSRRIATLQAVVGIILDIGTGLAAFHPRIFHGDISPKNIIISENGHATLVDFDLASDVDELPMTRATGMPGTDPYASPEWRIRGDTIDARTDIFSLGMTAVYALYGGSNLPSGLNDSRVVAGLGPFIDANLKCDATIKSVLARACAFELADRYATVQQFCHELRQATRPLLRSRPAAAGPDAEPAKPAAPPSPLPAVTAILPAHAPPPEPEPEKPAQHTALSTHSALPPGAEGHSLLVEQSLRQSVIELSGKPHHPVLTARRGPGGRRALAVVLAGGFLLLTLFIVWEMAVGERPGGAVVAVADLPASEVKRAPEGSRIPMEVLMPPRAPEPSLAGTEPAETIGEEPIAGGTVPNVTADVSKDAPPTSKPPVTTTEQPRPAGPLARTASSPAPLQSLAALKRKVFKRAKEIGTQCKRDELVGSFKNAPLEPIMLEFHIDAEGKVLGAKPSGSSVNSDIAECMEKKLENLKFGRFQGEASEFGKEFMI